MSDKKRKITLVVLGVLIVLLIAAGVTYAYFEARINQGAHGDVNVTGDTTDNLLFDVSNDISLSINQFNFGTGAGNLTSTAKASASLRANSTNNTATYNYYLYFKIDTNEYIYTTDDHKPEIVLTVTDPAGNPVTSIEGLTYVNATNADGTVVSGFDITTASGLFAIASNYEITSNSSTEATLQEWNITATFINLATDQEANTGKMMNGKIVIRRGEYRDTLTDYIIGLYTEDGVNNLYHHDGKMLATEANTEIGINVGDILDANDKSYRYAGSYETTNNWVCFGTDSKECDDEHLYRIIGVFGDQVKLIKAYEAGYSELSKQQDVNYGVYTYYKGNLTNIPGYIWSGSSNNENNIWSESTLNTEILNGTFLSKLGSAWTSKISTSEWKVGGNDYTHIISKNVSLAYQNEIVNPIPGTYGKNLITYNAKIGLTYVSDYGYASNPTNWTTVLQNYNNDANRNNNWMFLGVSEWTITRDSASSNNGYSITWDGWIGGSHSYYGDVVRPTFYLNSNVEYVGGTGTQADPYRIGV